MYRRSTATQTLGTIALVACLMSASALTQELTLLSRPEDPLILDTQGNGDSHMCRLGVSRYLVFSSRATNLVSDDYNASEDVFFKDLLNGEIERISVDDAGDDWPGDSSEPDISDDGALVVFRSSAQLTENASGTGLTHIFLRDRATGNTTMLSATAAGPGSSGSSSPRISANGSHVIFSSNAENLVATDSNNCSDIFVYDLATRKVDRVSTNSAGDQATGCSYEPDISADGSMVAFASDASNLVDNDINLRRDVFIKSLVSGEVLRLSQDESGTGGNRASIQPAIADNGMTTVFASDARNLAPDDTNLQWDIYHHEASRQPALSRLSLSNDGPQSDRDSVTPAISADGNRVVFNSIANNLVAGQLTLTPQPFLFDSQTEQLSYLLTVPGQSAFAPAISADGSLICMESAAAILPEDVNSSFSDIYTYNPEDLTWEMVSQSIDAVASQSNADSLFPDLSDDPRYVVFESNATVLDADHFDDGQYSDIFFLDRMTGEIERHPSTAFGQFGNRSSVGPTISADARYIALVTNATNLLATDVDDNQDVIRVDRLTGTISHVSLSLTDGGDSNQAQIDASGSRVVFRSSGDGLVPGDTNLVDDIFLWDVHDGIQQVSVSTTETPANSGSHSPRLASSGDFVVFLSEATNLVSEDAGEHEQVYLRDVVAGSTERISQNPLGEPVNGRSTAADVSRTGRYIAYITQATDVTSVNRVGLQVIRWDRFSGESENVGLVLPVDERILADWVRISDNGRYVLFASSKQLGAKPHSVWRYDTREGVLTPISRTATGVQNRSGLAGFAVHSSSHYVVFAADDDELTTTDHNGAFDVYLSDIRGGPGTIGMPVSEISVDEAAMRVALTITRANGARGAVSVEYRTSNVTATGAADYQVLDDVLIFGDADNDDVTLEVAIIDDNIDEPDEVFELALTNPQGGANLGPVSLVRITILDDDLSDLLMRDDFELQL